MKRKTIIEQGENGWNVGQIKERPAVKAHGNRHEEFKSNQLNALQLFLETQKSLLP
jgi:hypothetical protein